MTAGASFTGEGFIQYQVKTAASSKRRVVRQGDLYTTGSNLISLGFIASGESGTILQLGHQGVTDYAVLEVSEYVRENLQILSKYSLRFPRGTCSLCTTLGVVRPPAGRQQ